MRFYGGLYVRFYLRSNDAVDVPSDAGDDDFVILVPHPEEIRGEPILSRRRSTLLTQLERDWTTATYKRDAATLDCIIADDWVAFTGDGETVGKAQVMADANSGANTAVSISLQDMEVRLFGNAAVMTGRNTEKGQ